LTKEEENPGKEKDKFSDFSKKKDKFPNIFKKKNPRFFRAVLSLRRDFGSI